MNAPYISVSTINPAADQTQDFVARWNSGMAAILSEPGALGAQLFQMPEGRLVAVTIWESEAARKAAATKLAHMNGESRMIKPLASALPRT